MAGYRTRTETELTWDEIRRHAETDLRDLQARTRNAVLTSLDIRFNEGIQKGILQSVRVDPNELVRLAVEAMTPEVAPEPPVLTDGS